MCLHDRKLNKVTHFQSNPDQNILQVYNSPKYRDFFTNNDFDYFKVAKTLVESSDDEYGN